ncbi:MAG: Trehalose synthase [Methanoregula sp. PtaU1.Bin051]|nr:MAG: Trehalose synthase [Methanoregula sp. PtaU1.Bin051]
MRLVLIADARSIHTQRWAEHFAQKGHDVHLVTYDPSGIDLAGVNEHVIASRWRNLYLSYLPRHFSIKKLVRELQPDLIHAHFIAKYGFHLPDLKFHPSIVSAWGDDILVLPPKSRLIRHYTKRVLESVNLIYAVSQNIRDRIISDFTIPPEKVRHLPFGIDTRAFSPAGTGNKYDGEKVRIFSNRGFFPVYNTETLIEGFSLAYEKDPRLFLTLKGEGPDEEKIRNLVRSKKLSHAVVFMAKTPYADVPADYRAADIFVTTSISDGTPVSILEAMATALPSIATSVGGIPEWITDGENGILIPPQSPQKVANAILRLSSDPDLRRRLGSSARETVLARGRWDTLMVQVEKDYEELVNTYRKKGS